MSNYQYGPATPPPAQPNVVYVADPNNNSALAPVTSLLVGFFAISLAWIPLVGILAWFLAPISILFGVLGLRRGKTEHKVMSIIGLILGGLALLICMIWVIAFGAATANS